jgi:hypothetical protein
MLTIGYSNNNIKTLQKAINMMYQDEVYGSVFVCLAQKEARRTHRTGSGQMLSQSLLQAPPDACSAARGLLVELHSKHDC